MKEALVSQTTLMVSLENTLQIEGYVLSKDPIEVPNELIERALRHGALRANLPKEK